MPITEITKDEVIVSGYGLDTWLADVEKAFEAGFRFDFTDNQAYPQQIASHFNAIMKKPKVEDSEQKDTSGNQQGSENLKENAESKGKPGRKSKTE